jgi:hypothetical protein
MGSRVRLANGAATMSAQEGGFSRRGDRRRKERDPSGAAVAAAVEWAETHLHRTAPSRSARAPSGRGLAGGVPLFVALAVAGFSGAPGLLPVAWIAAALCCAMGLARLLAALLPAPRPAPAPAHRLEIAPHWTIIVALHREAGMVAGLLDALGALDWPRDRLDLIIACEADDVATIAAVEAARGRHRLRLLRLPKGRVRTKPRALQAALPFARGRFVTIYDAEDRPHPGQLRAAHTAFQTGPRELAVVQAPLVAHNHRESWITGQFALDYAVWFRLILPMLAKASGCLPLGGTSNHFKIAALRQVGGWDPWNVTEDADLGVRLARAGWRADLIAPPTWEEAPPDVAAWVRQRGRWMQGHFQTLGVHGRDARRLARDLGPAGVASVGVGMMSGPLAAAFQAPFVAGAATGVFTGEIAPWAICATGLTCFCHALAGLVAIARDGRWSLLAPLVTQPLYHALQAPALARAVWRIFTSPHTWDKTEHGAATRGRWAGRRP